MSTIVVISETMLLKIDFLPLSFTEMKLEDKKSPHKDMISILSHLAVLPFQQGKRSGI